MKVIDAHMHYSKIASFRDTGLLSSSVDYSEKGYIAEVKGCDIVRSICMGLTERPPSLFPDNDARTPMMADLSDVLPPEISICMGINPHTLSKGAICEMEEIIKNGSVMGYDIESNYSGRICGIKIYAGYYHYDVNDPIYAPAYDFAERHDLAVAIHSGDTYAERGRLIFSQPLSIDDLAVDRPDMRIVICHMGAPWIYDACEVAGKNKNVYMDISGMYVGDIQYFNDLQNKTLLLDRYRQALILMDNYDKVLFGTDWPLAPMSSYIDFCKKLVPPETYDKVFFENAKAVYKLDV